MAKPVQPGLGNDHAATEQARQYSMRLWRQQEKEEEKERHGGMQWHRQSAVEARKVLGMWRYYGMGMS